ncbi:MAG: SDR family oxidoreductase [Cohaesibacteraceae bacterium]|nr:SDR family oxidoreductase [Cohaesibacteraceae bacterium]
MHLTIFGAGYSGRAIAEVLSNEANSIYGSTRNTGEFEALKSGGITPFEFNSQNANSNIDLIAQRLAETTHLLVSIAPDDTGDPVLNSLREILGKSGQLQWIGYLSTVGVYGHHHGAWVNEDTKCQPLSSRSINRLEAESAWTSVASEMSVTLGIYRLSGIYGPGRNSYRKLQQGTARRLVKKNQVFNRIHIDDIARSVAKAAHEKHHGILNITDDMPAPPQDVILHAARLMGVKAPPEIDFETADLSPMARSFYGENKKVSNARLKQFLNGSLIRPDYQSAQFSMWENEVW